MISLKTLLKELMLLWKILQVIFHLFKKYFLNFIQYLIFLQKHFFMLKAFKNELL